MNYIYSTQSRTVLQYSGNGKVVAAMSIGKKASRYRGICISNHGTLQSLPSPVSVTKSTTSRNTTYFHPTITVTTTARVRVTDHSRKYHLGLHSVLMNARKRSVPVASFSTAKNQNPTEQEEFSKLSMKELKQLVVQSLRQYQRQQEMSTNRANDILRHMLERTTEQQSENGEAEDLSNIQTSLIDSWTTHQSSIMRDIKEEKFLEAGDADQYMQLKRFNEVRSSAESMTNILESMKTPTPHHYVVILKAWANTCKIAKLIEKSKGADVVGIPQRTQLILSQMAEDNDDNISVEAYNEVIKAWAYSSEYLRGTMSEHVFRKIEFPTGKSLRLIMRAHAWSNEDRSAFQATGHFMRMMRLLEAGREDMEPSSIDDYHLLCDAWTKAGDKNSSSKVYSVLQIMRNAFDKGHTNIRADLRCYRDALITMSRRQNVEDVGNLADETLKEMKDQMIFPDTECYRSAILAWKHVAMSRDCLYPEHAIRRAQELLQEMTEAYHRTTQILIQPTTEDYNHVLQAMNLSKNPQTIDYAQDLFKTLKDEASSTGGPNAHSYRYLLGILRNSRSPTKFSAASQLLQEVKDKYANDEHWNSSESAKESVMDVFAAFVRVCGAPASTSKHISDCTRQDLTKMMTVALRVLGDSKKLGLTLNSDTYSALVEACDSLLSVNEKERESVLSNVFHRACEEGFVNQSLLESFKSASSAHLYARLVVTKSILMEDIKVVPESWTRNVKGYREGNQVMPLSIHGNFTFTKRAAEYRMRKLRQQKNKKFLRGGRLK